MPRAFPRILRARVMMAAAGSSQGFVRRGRFSKVAGAGVAALGGVAMGLVAWPLMDGYMMPWMASWSFTKAGNAALDEASVIELAEGNPHAAELFRKLQEAVSTGNASLTVVQDGTLSYKQLLAVGHGRPLCAIDLSCVNDSRVLIWSILHQMYTPLGSLGTAVNSYVRAVYIAAALLTGNEGIEHTDFMFFLAFLDYLSNGIRSAPKQSRPLLVIRNLEELRVRAAEAEADGDKDRATRLRSGASTLLSIAERLSVTEGLADCIVVSNAPARLRPREVGAQELTVHPNARTIAA